MMNSMQPALDQTKLSRPAFLTGTRQEYLGKRPLPTLVRRRPVVVVLGPEGAGKSEVALRIAGPDSIVIPTMALHRGLIDWVRTSEWPEHWLEPAPIVFDESVWLRGRPGIVRGLVSLLRQRSQQGYRSIIVQPDHDGSIDCVLAELSVGAVCTVGLRLPVSRRARLNFAREICRRHGLDESLAPPTTRLEHWSYQAVRRMLGVD